MGAFRRKETLKAVGEGGWREVRIGGVGCGRAGRVQLTIESGTSASACAS